MKNQYFIFNQDGKWNSSINDSLENYVLLEGQISVESDLVYDWTKVYTLVDGEIVVTAGTEVWHSPPPIADVAMAKLREERNKLLEDVVDRIARIYTNQNKAVPQDVLDYRQTLLDMPDNVVPELDDSRNEFTNFTWPEEPTE